jgi:pimeloyl-ACP methyl ester carboxylesterase
MKNRLGRIIAAFILPGLGLAQSNVKVDDRPAVAYHTIKVGGLDIFYREAGPVDGPVILLLHGLPSSSRMYEPLLNSSLTQKYRLIAPDYPGFGHSSWPDHREFAYTFDHLAQVVQAFADQLDLRRYTLFMQDYGGPVGFRMAMAHPERVRAMIVQNANSYEEGLSPLWAVRRAFFEDRAAHEAAVRANLLSLEATRGRHIGTSPNPWNYNPDLWVDEYYFLNQPGQADIQIDLFYDYRTNIAAYPKWQQWLRDNTPPLMVIWGKYDPSFAVGGAEAYKRDDPRAEVHVFDAGHFAMDTNAPEVERLTQAFMDGLPTDVR